MDHGRPRWEQGGQQGMSLQVPGKRWQWWWPARGEAVAMEGGGWLWDVVWPWFEIRDRRHSSVSAWVIDGGPFCQNWKDWGVSPVFLEKVKSWLAQVRVLEAIDGSIRELLKVLLGFPLNVLPWNLKGLAQTSSRPSNVDLFVWPGLKIWQWVSHWASEPKNGLAQIWSYSMPTNITATTNGLWLLSTCYVVSLN